MFTGIIEATANVMSMQDHRLILGRPQNFDDIKIGSSISVSGVCLSVVHFDDASMSFDVIDETLEKTKLGSLQSGDRVNLERSMRADSRLDGHVVQGHVEGTASILSNGKELTIELAPSMTSSVIEKGSIAIDGASLTVARLDGNRCTIALIPHTIEHTTLGNLKEKDLVNIETDVLTRYHQPSHS